MSSEMARLPPNKQSKRRQQETNRSSSSTRAMATRSNGPVVTPRPAISHSSVVPRRITSSSASSSPHSSLSTCTPPTVSPLSETPRSSPRREENERDMRGETPLSRGSNSGHGASRSGPPSLTNFTEETRRSSLNSEESRRDERRATRPPACSDGGLSSGEILRQIQDFCQRQEAFNAKIEEHLQTATSVEKQRRTRRLPKAVTANVRDVYKTLSRDDGEQIQWDLTKSFTETENQAVNQHILAGFRSTDTETSTTVIRAAMRAHFKTKLRQYNNERKNISNEVLTAQKVRSRLNTKKNQRIKALNMSTTYSAEEKGEYVKYMTTEYMSSEHSMSETDEEADGDHSGSDTERNRVKMFSVSTLPWQSVQLGDLMHRLDRKSHRRRSAKSTNMTLQRQNRGIVSSRPAPEDAPPFALA